MNCISSWKKIEASAKNTLDELAFGDFDEKVEHPSHWRPEKTCGADQCAASTADLLILTSRPTN